MASIKPHNGKWRVFIFLRGVRKTKVFDVKAKASAWAAQTEIDILAGKQGDIPNKTFQELLERYRDEVSATKKGERWERMRIGLICRDELAKVKLEDLCASDFAAWRDRRLRSVTAASVRRERTLLSHAVNIALKEWGWLKINPLKDVKMPAAAPARDRRISQDEIDRLLLALGYDYDVAPVMISTRVGAAMLFAIETAMRAGEICGLTWTDVDLDKRVATLRMTKNGTARRVPLSTEAVRILNQVRTDSALIFNLSTSQVDSLFRKAKTNAMISELHFHDCRHEAITRLAKKLDVLDLARMVGHRDLRQLMVYYNVTAEELATKLG